jgi:DNA-binding MarR family transcriptional regulator
MTPDLDSVIHPPARLRIVALLASVEQAEFAFIRDQLQLSDSALSKHAGTLEAAGYVEIIKGHPGRRPKTWLKLIRRGRSAFDVHLRALRQIVRTAGASLSEAPNQNSN